MKVLIIGAGGHGQVVADILLRQAGQDNSAEVVGFLDDDEALTGQTALGLPILGPVAMGATVFHDAIIVAVGNNDARACLMMRLGQQGERFTCAVHPSAILAPSVCVGDGTVICAGCVINPCTRIGAGAIINTAASIDHHSVIGDYVHIAPGVHTGGDVRIGKGAFVGLGASILPQCTIGEGAIIGAGAVVVNDVPAHATVVGVPARITRYKEIFR